MTQRFESEELDDASLEYLRSAHRHNGRGFPGIYLDHKSAQLASAWLPGCGAIVGLVLVAATLFITWGSLEDPINNAMLQTAGLFLGVWLIVAWVRSRTARNRPDYVGHFKLIDPLYLWQTSGRGVWVTSLSGLRDADTDHKYDNNGNYTTSQVTVRLNNEQVVINVKPGHRAERLEAYLNLLREFERGTPAERGFATLEELDRREAEEEGDEPPPPIHRQVDAIPEPHQVRFVAAWWPYPIVIVTFVACFFLSKSLCTIIRDDEFFELVRDHRPPELRAYLIDQRNTRHRAEVQQRLARWHEQTAQQIENRKGHPQLCAGLASLIRVLGQETRPVITIAIKQTQQPDDARKADALDAQALSALRNELLQNVTRSLTPNLIPADMTDFGEVAEGPAMIEVVSQFSKNAEGAGYQLDWAVTLQAAPEAPKFVWKTQTVTGQGMLVPGNTRTMLNGPYNEFKTRFDRALATR